MMDFKLLVAVVIGFCCLNTVTAYLRCIECTHIAYDPSFTFQGSQEVYNILRGKFNPACAMQEPLDRRTYDQQVMTNQMPSTYAVSETICQSLSDDNRCNYIYGDVHVFLQNYNVELKLNMHVRNCMTTPELENTCYQRNNYNEIKNFFQDRLSFLSRDLTVKNVYAHQCVCNENLCSPRVSSAVRIQGVSFVFISLLVSYLLSKVY